MSEFTYENWLATLALVYERATSDVAYRELCLSDPRAAVRAVSDIEIPPHFRFEFVAHRKDVFSSLLLPPLLIEADRANTEKAIIAWALSTHPTMGTPPPLPPSSSKNH